MYQTVGCVALPLPFAWMVSGRFRRVRCGLVSCCVALCTHFFLMLLCQAAKSHPKNRAKGTPHFG